MPAAKKFMFDTRFDEEPRPEEPAEVVEEEPEAEEAEEAPTFSQDDVNAARDEGFAAGRDQGVREAAGVTERMTAEALGAVGERLAELFRIQQETNTATAADAVAVAAAVVRKLFPDLSRRNALGEVERLIEDVMDTMMGEPRVTIRVDAELHTALEEHVAGLATRHGFEGQIDVVADPELPAGDCRIEWRNGGAERNSDALWQEIDLIVARNLGDGAAKDDDDEYGGGTGAAPDDQLTDGDEDHG